MTETTEIDKIVAVSNTGPLISAFQCGRTDLLKRYFSVIYITASELVEFDRHGWTDDIRRLLNEGLLVVVKPLTEREKEEAERVAKRIAADPVSGDPDWRNHLPEAETMVLMQQRTSLIIEQILLDEKAARNVAQELGLRLTGFPGVLGRAGLDGLVTRDEIRQLLKSCQKQGTHYSDAFIETVAQIYGR
jgi:predicted nucleic acid-binding protein